MNSAELRQSAWRDLNSAKILCGSNPDLAAYLAGQSAELALKARYCSKHGLIKLPETARERRALRLEHDLQSLLRLSDTISINAESLDAIDLAIVSDWDNQDRYKPKGRISQEKAERRVAQTFVLFDTLVQYEIVESLSRIESILGQTFGPFNLFAWWQESHGSPWKTTIATQKVNSRAEHEFILHAFMEAAKGLMAPDLLHNLAHSAFEAFNPEHPIALMFYNLDGAIGAIKTIKSSTVIGDFPLRAGRRSGLLQISGARTSRGEVHKAYVIALQSPPFFLQPSADKD